MRKNSSVRLSPSRNETSRLPAQSLTDEGIVGVIVADVDSFSVGGKFALDELSATVDLDEQSRARSASGDDLASAQVEDALRRLGSHSGQQHRLDAIVDVGEVPQLLPAPDFERLALRAGRRIQTPTNVCRASLIRIRGP